MNLATTDWLVLGGAYAFLFVGVLITKRYMRSVADFLAAGRTAGRYILSVSTAVAMIGAITIIANFESGYESGFVLSWWLQSQAVVLLLVTVSGWVVYRFRQTRCLTLAEFFERRYSRRFRIAAGVVAFIAGLINFGIFPAVGARFFIQYVGLPPSFEVLGVSCSTYAATMLVLLGTALYFVLAGGQVAVMVTDFLQGMFCNVVFIILPLYLLACVGWPRLVETVLLRPPGESLIDPFDTAKIEDFNLQYILIGSVGLFYSQMSWQGTQAYYTSARNAHEAKMGNVLTVWRVIPQNLMLLLVPLLAYTVLHHADFGDTARVVNDGLAAIPTEAAARQARTPLVLVAMLPPGLLGAFAAVMLAAFVSTHDTYLHSWASVLVQDVIMPLKKERWSEKEHLLWLRLAIVGVAIFVFCFSLVFAQSQKILLYFAVTGAIFAGGSGAVIIGGLYWKRGTTPGAWAALIGGGLTACSGVILRERFGDKIPNGQYFWAISMATATALYVVVSLLTRPSENDLDQLLARGREQGEEEEAPVRGWRALWVTKDFSRADRLIYFATYAWTGLWTLIFIAGTIWGATHEIPDATWAGYWRFFIVVQVVAAIFAVVWFAVGGYRDIRRMLSSLAVMKRDERDDGTVRGDE